MKKLLLGILFFSFLQISSVNSQIITTIAGGVTGHGGFWGDGGPATAAELYSPVGLVIDTHGNLFFGEGFGNRVRVINLATGIITTYAGTGSAGFLGDNGPATAAKLNGVSFLSIDTANNLYITDAQNNKIRKVAALTGVITTFAGNGTKGSLGDGGPATAAELWLGGVACDTFGNVYLGDYDRVRKVDQFGTITTIAGDGLSGATIDGVSATSTHLGFAQDICTDFLGNIYVADSTQAIRKIDHNTGLINRIAGTGDNISSPYAGDGTPATNCHIVTNGIKTDLAGNIYNSGFGNDRVVRISSGIISTIAGTGLPGFSGDNSPATAAQLYIPEDFTIDACGNMYIADFANKRIRKVSSASSTTPAIFITASLSGSICAGTPVTYTASVTGEGTSPTYKWYVNGVTVSASSSYTYTPSNLDSVRCVVTRASNYCSPSISVNSNELYMTVNPSVTPVITITASPGANVCAGTPVIFSATISGGGATPAYTWYVNGAVVSSPGSTYTYTPVNGDKVSCVLTGSAPCATAPTASSAPITMVVNPYATPAIAITASPGATVCAGTSVTYTAAITGGGSTPAYTWYVNGVVVSTTGGTYTYIPATGDVVSCKITSSSPCATSPTAISSPITMVVNPTVIPTIAITASPGAAVCSGTPVTFTAAITGGGAAPVYSWYVNGTVVSAAGSAYTYTPANGDSVRCVLGSIATCASPVTVSSHTVYMSVTPSVTPAISIAASPGDTICTGNSVAFTVSVLNGGTSPAYQWYVNGVPVGIGGSYYGYTPANGDSIRCVLTGSVPCSSPAVVSSSDIDMTVQDPVVPYIGLSGVVSAAIGSTVTVAAFVSGAGSYIIHWLNSGVEFATTTVPAVTYTKVKEIDSITARVVSLGICRDSANSSGLHMVFSSDIEVMQQFVKSGITIYPNPAHDELTIAASNKISTVTITNLLGQIVYANSNSMERVLINTANFPAGVYLIKIVDIDGRKTVDKFVKE